MVYGVYSHATGATPTGHAFMYLDFYSIFMSGVVSKADHTAISNVNCWLYAYISLKC